ncbi:hypothetical protein [Chryseobacterium sp. 18068]|uniref:hypothetical protein n=1 Tax=Chryseobacterium sp. 18068 TaxID=2681414 RepID=UPI001358973E|nr:hypothetical protein [Chryseobacterium sp. 18068]
MEANELRIGNYANHSELGIVEIIAVGRDYIYCVYNGETFYESIGRFSPIPLSEEWMLKFDFDPTANNLFYHKNIQIEKQKNTFNLRFVNPDFTTSSLRRIKYVHQLQNLFFALKGKELTINVYYHLL